VQFPGVISQPASPAAVIGPPAGHDRPEARAAAEDAQMAGSEEDRGRGRQSVLRARERRYKRASVIVTSNEPFGRWGEVFGGATVAAAMIDRLVHHASAVSLKGDSYRLKDRDLGRVPTDDQG